MLSRVEQSKAKQSEAKQSNEKKGRQTLAAQEEENATSCDGDGVAWQDVMSDIDKPYVARRLNWNHAGAPFSFLHFAFARLALLLRGPRTMTH